MAIHTERMDLETEIFLKGGRFKKLLDQKASEMGKRYDLKKASVEILYYLATCGEQNTSTDIYHQLVMTKGHISQAVDQLSKKGYIEAIQDRKDRRYVHYLLTDAADAIVEEMGVYRARVHRKIFEGVSEKEIQEFQRISKIIWNNMKGLLADS